MTQEEYYRNAVRELSAQTKKTPHDSELWRTLAQAQMMIGEFDAAIDSNIEALKLKPENVNALILMGNIYFNGKKDLESARQFFERALVFEPENSLALANYASALAKGEMKAEAVTMFKRAIKADPRNMNAYAGLALLHSRMNNWGGAYQVASRGLELGKPRPEDPTSRLFEMLVAVKVEAQSRLETTHGKAWADELVQEDV